MYWIKKFCFSLAIISSAVIALLFVVKSNVRVIVTEYNISTTSGLFITKTYFDHVKKKDVEDIVIDKANKEIKIYENGVLKEYTYYDIGIKASLNSKTIQMIEEDYVLFSHKLGVDYDTSSTYNFLTSLNNNRNINLLIDIEKLSRYIEENIGDKIIVHLEDYYIEEK